jgi:hypothetical protein
MARSDVDPAQVERLLASAPPVEVRAQLLADVFAVPDDPPAEGDAA